MAWSHPPDGVEHPPLVPKQQDLESVFVATTAPLNQLVVVRFTRHNYTRGSERLVDSQAGGFALISNTFSKPE